MSDEICALKERIAFLESLNHRLEQEIAYLYERLDAARSQVNRLQNDIDPTSKEV